MGKTITCIYDPRHCTVTTGYNDHRSQAGKCAFPFVIHTLLTHSYKQRETNMYFAGDVMMYADGTAIWTNGQEDLEGALNYWNQCFMESWLQMNLQKSEILIIQNVDV